jgi:hypothetical protein
LTTAGPCVCTNTEKSGNLETRAALAEDSACVVTGVSRAALGGDTGGFCSLQPAAVISTIKINARVRVINCLLLNEVIFTTRVGKGLGGLNRLINVHR